MAYTAALSIFQSNGTDEDELRVAYNSFIDQIQKKANYTLLNNTAMSGDPQAGSVIVRRLMTSTVRPYGTARGNYGGDKISNNGVIINLDQRNEIVEEVEQWDIDQYGLPGLIERRSQNLALSMARSLDTAFFTEAVTAGTEETITSSTTEDKIEELIVSLETLQNDNVDGVDREMMVLCLKPAIYGEMLTYVDGLANPANGGVQLPTYHGVRVLSNFRQSKDAIIMTDGMAGAVALPVAIKDFRVKEEPYSLSQIMGIFFHYGVQVVAEDLIRYADFTEVSA